MSTTPFERPTVTNVRETLRLFHGEGTTFEIRMPKTKWRTVSGYFKDPDQAAQAVMEYDAKCEGIYFTLNPVLPDLLARSLSRLSRYADCTTSDQEVVRRHWFVVDLDPKRPRGISSTDVEHEAALDRAKACRDLLKERGWPEPVLADSGNGAHLCYRLDLPNDAEIRELFSRALETLDLLLSDDAVAVDLTTFNAARIWKLYGTQACKGDATDDRPQRRSALLDVPPQLDLVTREQLVQLSRPPEATGIVAKDSGGSFDLESWISRQGLQVASTGAWQDGKKWLLSPCPWNSAHTNRSAYIVQLASGAIAAGCHHNSCAHENWSTLRDLKEPGWRGCRLNAPKAESDPYSDFANSLRFAGQHGREVRFIAPLRGWHIWDGCRFHADETGEVMRRAWATAHSLLDEARACPDEQKAKALASWGAKCHSLSRLKAMIELAEAQPGLAARPIEFDADTWALNTPSGVVDLRTGAGAPHGGPRMLTKVSGVGYDPQATCPTWDRFLEQIMAGRQDLVSFLKRAIGYTVTGSVREHVAFLLYGTGSNGKTTFLETLRYVLGDYACGTPSETFMQKTQSNGQSSDVARLRGTRFVTASETEDGQRLAEVLIKKISGGDIITARFMYAEFFDFQPQFKVFLATNHKPQIKGTDDGVWRRIKLIPFEVSFKNEQKDMDLPEKLKAEAPGILRWAVEGCLEWQRLGLREPSDVVAATSDYRAEMDLVAAFLEERCVLAAPLRVQSSALYADYRKWCEENGETPMSQKALRLRLKERGITNERNRRGWFWCGVGLAAQGEDEREDRSW